MYSSAMNVMFRAVTFMLLIALLAAATVRTSGLDYPVYLAEFLDPVNSLSSREVGYVALITIVGQFSGFWLVLLVGNASFLLGHSTALNRMRTVAQSLAFTFYAAYIGLFLIYGSPRRLIAHSLISYIILAIAFGRRKVKQHAFRYFVVAGVAASFHASALVFMPVLVIYTHGKDLFSSGKKLLGVALALVVGGYALHVGGVTDYVTTKVMYYAVDAAVEQAYLEEVPSVTSGLVKRFMALALLWLGTRHIPQVRRPALDFCILETVIYGALGSVSPVLAVTASYFSIGYLIPMLSIYYRSGTVSLYRMALLGAAAIYYIPTSIGLIRLFGDFYVS